MSIATIVPVTISPAALAFVERIGQCQELEKIIDRARQVVPHLRSIEVAVDDATDEMPPGIVLWAHRDDIGPVHDSTHQDWIDWLTATFPPEVCQNFVLLPIFHDNGR